MFTGIVAGTGCLRSIEQRDGDMRLVIQSDIEGLSGAREGDSISVSGACLTILEPSGDTFAADVSLETLACTSLGGRRQGDDVNLELAMRASDRLGGHLVSGHVDCTGTVVSVASDARSIRLTIEIPKEYARYVAKKGSVCVDGVSLTVNEVSGNSFELNIIPHTAEVTNIGDYRKGTVVNVEVDLLARYLERLLAQDGDGITIDFLKAHGYA